MTTHSVRPQPIKVGGAPLVLEYPVAPGHTYQFRTTCVQDGPQNPRGALVSIEYLNDKKHVIPGPYAAAFASEKYGYFRYVSVESKATATAPSPDVVPLEPPAQASSVRLSLHAYQASEIQLPFGYQLLADDKRLCLSGCALLGHWECREDTVYNLGLVLSYAPPGVSSRLRILGTWRTQDGVSGMAASESPRVVHSTDEVRLGDCPSDVPRVIALCAPAGAQSVTLHAEVDADLGFPSLQVPVHLAELGSEVALEATPVWFSMPVQGGREYVLLARCVSPAGEGRKGALVRVLFRTASGQLIDGPLECCGQSRTEGDYWHLTVSPEREYPRSRQIVVFRAPASSARIDLGFRSWGAGEGRRLCSGWKIVSSPFTIEPAAGELIVRELPASSLWEYSLRGSCFADEGQARGALLVGQRFFDAEGRDITPNRLAGFSHSSKAGLSRAVSAWPGGSRAAFELSVVPPENAVLAVISVERPAGGNGGRLVSSLDLVPTRLRVADAPAAAILRAAESPTTSPQQAEAAAVALLRSDPNNVGAAELLLRICVRQGRLKESVSLTDRIEQLTNPVPVPRRLANVRAVATELDTQWLPRIPPLRTPYSPSEDRRIAHLFKIDRRFEETGGAVRNHNTVVAQAHAGLKPFVITPLGYPRAQRRDPGTLCEVVDGVTYYRPQLGHLADLDALGVDALLTYDTVVTAAILRKVRPAIIHAASGIRGYELALKALALRERFGIPVVYEVRSLHEHSWGPSGLSTEISELTDARARQENRCSLAADKVVTISQCMREELIDRGVPEDKIVVVPNAVDGSKFVVQPRDDAFRARIGIQSRVVLGYISNVSRREGHDVLLSALPLLRNRGYDAGLLIVGVGPELENLKALAGSLGIAEHVVFTGAVPHDDINDYYAAIDIFVVPRRRDYASDLVTPLKPFEAMAMERTIIVSDRPALSEVVEPGKRGMTFRTESPESLARVAAELIENNELARRLAAEGRRWVLENRTWEQNAEAYRNVYEELLQRSPSNVMGKPSRDEGAPR
jgi:glycosyltransferase involved in cell wall biosynthesis